MTTTALRLHTLSYSQARTYLIAAAFVVGNMLLPQLAHLVPKGGLIFLPIYFFTIVGAYKYGWKVGLLTATLSPLANHLIFGMPALAVLPAILTKSVLLALAAAFSATHFKKVSIPALALVVLSYQAVGTLVEWALIGNFFEAIRDFRVGLPGMALQIFGGYWAIRYLADK